MNIAEYIPARLRKPTYGILAVAFLIVGAVQVAYASINEANPPWLVVALAVVPFVASAVGFAAHGNTVATPSRAAVEDAPIEDIDDDLDDEIDDEADTDEEATEELDDIETTKADEQAALDEKLTDETPVDDDYEPRH
jgi:hypothetical protein